MKNEKYEVKLSWGILVVIALLLMNIANTGSQVSKVLLVIAIIIGLLRLGLWAFVKYENSKEDRVCAGKELTLNHDHQQRSYSESELRDRDEQRRSAQLDSFLKNGIIDKKEYLALKSRYEKNQ